MHKYTAICMALILLISVILTESIIEPVSAEAPPNAPGLGVATVDSYADKWAVVPVVSAPPNVDGMLNENFWHQAAQLGNFRTAFYHEAVADGPMYRLAYDATHLYIGGSFTAEEAATLARIELVASPSATGGTYYVAEIPVDLETRLVSPTNWSYDWRPEKEWQRINITPSAFELKENRVSERWELEAAIPLSAFGAGFQVEPGDEWRLNLLHIHNLNTKPMISWVPVRNSQLSETTMTSYDGPVYLSANLVGHGNWGTLLFGDGPQADVRIPEEWALEYIGFNKKRLRLEYPGQSGNPRPGGPGGNGRNPDVELPDAIAQQLELYWKDPSGETIQLDPPIVTRDGGWLSLDLVHPEALLEGVYQLRLQMSPDHSPNSRPAVFTFDRQSLIEAGLDVVGRVFPTDDTVTPITLAPPSAEVQRVMGLIPEQFGVPHIGIPDRPHLRPHLSLYQLSEDGQHIIANETGMAYPNEQYPETQSLTAVNRKGETVEYPYYEDAEGRRYFFSAALWNHQARRARQDGAALAPNDPLGAARILHRFAEASENYVPRSNNEWNTYPLDSASGPPYNFRSGIWSIWKPEELNTMDYMLDMYEQVKKTDAFEVLSQELGEDVELRVRQQLFQPSIDYTLSMPIIMHNTDPYIWQRLIRMSKLFGEPDYIHLAMEWIEQFMRSQFVSDGFWKEITPAYHSQVVNNIVIAIGSLNGYSDPLGYVSPRTGKRFDNLDMSKEYPQLAKAQQMVNILTYPNGKQVPIQDTWASQNRTPQPNAGPMLLPAAGIGRLTTGTGTGQGTAQSQLYLMFTPKYGHNQWDPLNLTLFAEGQELLPDIGYTYTKYRQFANSTIGHNTVVVNSRNMTYDGASRHGGNVKQFVAETGALQVLRASYEASYKETEEYSREPWFIPFADDKDKGYVLDLFRVIGGERHEYTLQGDANHDAYFQTSLALGDVEPYLLPPGTVVREPESHEDFGSAAGHYPGYMYVRDVQEAELTDDRYDVTLVTIDAHGNEQAKLLITGLLESGDNELYIGRSPSVRATRLNGSSQLYDNNDEADKYDMPKLVLRRDGTDLHSTFVTVMEPYKTAEQPRIEWAERLEPDQAPSGAVAVQITYGNTTDILLSNPHHPDQPIIIDDLTMYGELGMVRLIDGEVHDLYLAGGTLLTKGSHQMTGTGAVTGSITATQRIVDGDPYNALVTDSLVPNMVAGRYVVVTHPDGTTSGYEIGQVIREADQTILVLAEHDPGFTINEDGSSQQLFMPAKSWNGAHTFSIVHMNKLENIVPGDPSPTGMISGTIYGVGGTALAGADIRLTGYSSIVDASAVDGSYTLTGVPAGWHRVTVSMPGYTRTVSEPVYVSAGQGAGLNITLPDANPPVLSDVTSATIPGEPVIATSSKDGVIYLVPTGTLPIVSSLEKAIRGENGEVRGVRTVASAGEAAQLDTTGLPIGRYVVYAVDGQDRVSSGHAMIIIPAGQTIIDDMDPLVLFSGTWLNLSNVEYVNGTNKYSNMKDAYVEIPFYGKQAIVLGHRNNSGGLADVYLDGEFVETVDYYQPELKVQDEIFNTGLLTEGAHVIRIVVKAERFNGPHTNAQVRFDALRVLTDSEIPPIVSNVTTGPLVAGTPVQAMSNENGRLYLVPRDTTPELASLEATVTHGEGRSVAVTEHEYGQLDSDGLPMGSYIVYAVDVDGNVSVGSTPIALLDPNMSLVNDDGLLIQYSGTWDVLSSSSYNGGTARRAGQVGAYVEIPFYGSGATVIGTKSVNNGYARVYVDGEYKMTIDTYSSSTQYQQLLYHTGSLEEGVHVIRLEVAGTRRNTAGSTGNMHVMFDALLVDAAGAYKPPALSQITEGPLLAGEPLLATSSKEGTMYLVPNDTGTTRAAIESAGSSSMGRKISVAANTNGSLDTAGLPTGLYRVHVIDQAGNVSAGSAGIAIVAPTGVDVPYHNATATYSGTWTQLNNEAYISGGFRYARERGAYIEIPFYGVQATVIGHRNVAGGLANIYLDGEYQETVDYYYPELVRQYAIYQTPLLSEGLHVLRIEVLAERSPGADNYQVRIDTVLVDPGDSAPLVLADVSTGPLLAGDWLTATSNKNGNIYVVPHETGMTKEAIEAAGSSPQGRTVSATANDPAQVDTTDLATGLYRVYAIDERGTVSTGSAAIVVVAPEAEDVDDTSPIVSYWGRWFNLENEAYIGGTSRYAREAGSGVEIPFYGTQASIMGHINVSGGLADIYIDGEYQTTVDYYNPTLERSYEIYRTDVLPEGLHVVRIEVLGQRTHPATNDQVRFDALQVHRFSPVIAGVTDGGIYGQPVTITIDPSDIYTATLGGDTFTSGETVSADGEYVLVVQDSTGNYIDVGFTIDQTPPAVTVTGVTYGDVYHRQATITIDDATEYTATLNGVTVTNGDTVDMVGEYELLVRDAAGNETTVSFIIGNLDLLGTMREKVDSYVLTDGINTVLADQLRYRLDVIELLVGQAEWETAILYMNDLLNYILDPSVQAQQLITAAATVALEEAANLWIQLLTEFDLQESK